MDILGLAVMLFLMFVGVNLLFALLEILFVMIGAMFEGFAFVISGVFELIGWLFYGVWISGKATYKGSKKIAKSIKKQKTTKSEFKLKDIEISLKEDE